MALTPNQIGVLMYGVNFGPSTPGTNDINTINFLDIAIAIAHGESGWNPSAVNGAMVGLWQINTSVHKKYSKEDLLKPNVNTLEAKRIHDEAHGWTPWDAYNDKSPQYKAGLGHGKAVHDYLKKQGQEAIMKEYFELADTVAADSPPPVDLGDVAQLDPVARALDFVRKGAATIGVFALGAILLILGVVFLVVNTKAGKAVVNNTPVGVVKKALK